MSKLLEDFHYNPVQHTHCICLLKIYLNVLKEKSKEQADEATAVKNSSGTEDEPQDNNKEYINNGHNSISKDKKSDIKTENNIKRDIPEFLKQSNEERATEKNKTKDRNKAKAETKNRRKTAIEEEAGGLNRTENKMAVSKAKKKGFLPIKFNLSKTVDIAYITKVQNEFFATVCLLKFNTFTNNKKTVMKVTEEDAIKITNFFFSQIIGKPALHHLSSLVQSYNKHDNTKPDKRVTK